MREPAEATHDGLVPDWLFPDWPVDARVRAFVTTRGGGVSTGAYAALNAGGSGVPPDEPAAVAENRRRIAARLPHRPTWLDQVHGTDVIRVSAPRDDAPVADAAVTQALDVPLAVRVADCLPVFLADRAGSAVGVAHAGWRGLAAGVLERTLEALDRPSADVVAWLGPGIGADAFEVGDDVRAAFTQSDAGAAIHFRAGDAEKCADKRADKHAGKYAGKYLADLAGLARRRLAAAGVREVHGGQWCTVRDPVRFYSYRRDGVTGRMAAVIWLASKAAR